MQKYTRENHPRAWPEWVKLDPRIRLHETGVKITYFPVIHARRGSIGYKLEWLTPGGRTLSMIYTGDTKPERLSVEQARNSGRGVDVFIHEMGLPAQIWAMKSTNAETPPAADSPSVRQVRMVQNLLGLPRHLHRADIADDRLGRIVPSRSQIQAARDCFRATGNRFSRNRDLRTSPVFMPGHRRITLRAARLDTGLAAHDDPGGTLTR